MNSPPDLPDLAQMISCPENSKLARKAFRHFFRRQRNEARFLSIVKMRLEINIGDYSASQRKLAEEYLKEARKWDEAYHKTLYDLFHA